MLALLALFVVLPGHALGESVNPIGRYFSRIPESEAHVRWGSTSGERLPVKDLDVLVWNVKKGSREAFSEEFMKYGSGRELLLVQEVFTAPYFSETMAWFSNYEWDLGLSFRYRAYNNEATGNMIGSIVRPDWVKVEHTFDLEPVTRTPKTNVYAKYPVEGLEEELLVISIHGINFADGDAFTRHLKQVKTQIDSHAGPVILAGDFNTRTKERYRELVTLATSLKLTEVKWINGEERMRAVGTKNILDHAFVRGFQVRHAEVIPSKGSDHRPMVLTMDFL
jgi:endonuclease/exonuclease/phosphatase (EEP) superfamily protein YafD